MGKKLKYYDLATIIRMKRLGLIDFLKDFSPKNEIESTARILTAGQHSIITGQAANLIERILTVQGDQEDFIDAVKYSICCLDAKKYGLDLDQAQIKYRYQELYSKYMIAKKEEKHE